MTSPAPAMTPAKYGITPVPGGDNPTPTPSLKKPSHQQQAAGDINDTGLDGDDAMSARQGSSRGNGGGGGGPWWTIHLFRGMITDVRRRAPYYASDWTDAWDYRVVPATVYMYFAK
jgi:hypothetical protein